MPILTFDKILKIISTILTILSYAVSLIGGEKIVADEDDAG